MSRSHVQRILTSLLLLPLLGWVVFSGDPALAAAISAVAGLGLLEFYAMFWPGRERLAWKGAGLVLAMAIIWAPLPWSAAPLVFLALLATAMAFLLAYTREDADAFASCQIFLFGLLYLPLVLRLARTLSGPEIILVLLTTFAADTGAYYCGSHFGGPKIWPAVSPKKTWAGSMGGLLSSALICTLVGIGFTQTPWTQFALLGAGLNLAAQCGDFFESALKRTQGIKDSGRILPGHGGILDRIDSLLFVVPAYCGAAALTHFFG